MREEADGIDDMFPDLGPVKKRLSDDAIGDDDDDVHAATDEVSFGRKFLIGHYY